jgi:Abnormal spindle-like microcephaly-assoc'd, ASPM-SPD-2-Hydin
MTQQQILELAKQGNINAIEALINQLLRPQGIKAKVGLKDSCLYVALVSAQVPERQAIVKFIRKQILQWGVKSLRNAKIYAAQWGQNFPAWQQEISLKSVNLAVLKNNVSPNRPVKTNQYQSGQNFHQVQVDSDVEINGQLKIGKLLMRVDGVNGNAVTLENQQVHFLKPRSQPVLMLPQPFGNLIGRLNEIKSAYASLESNQSVEFYGGLGLGKSVLLRHLTPFIQPLTALDGGVGGVGGVVVYFHAIHQPVSDLLQSLFDIFYEPDTTYKPTPDEICQALESKQVFIILDDNNLTSDEIKQLQKSLPKSLFILASPQPRLNGGYTAQLSGFGLQDTLVLMAQLQYAVRKEEYPAVEALINCLDGNPWLLLLAVTSIKKNVHTLAGLVVELQSPTPSKVLIQQVLATLPQSHQRILALLAAVGGVALFVEQIAAISGIDDTEAILLSLVEWNLVEVDCVNERLRDCDSQSAPFGNRILAEEYRYSINGTLAAVLQQEWDLTVPINSAFEYFATLAEQYRSLPNLLPCEDAIMELLLNGKVPNWENVLRLVKAVESSLCLSKQWGLWEQVLQVGLQAAKAKNDKSSVAWILHQLGSRALCLSEIGTARLYLSQAMQIRQSLKDENAIKVTSQNFKLLTAVPARPETGLPQVAFQYQPSNPRLQFNFAVTSLFCVGLASSFALYIPQLKTTPKPNAVTKKLPPKPNKVTLSLNPQNLNFGNQAVNTRSQKQNIKITNKGSTLLQIGEFKRINKQGDFEINSNSCPIAIPPNRTCNISIIFAPIESGKHQASLPITNSDNKTIQQLLISGVATQQQEFLDEIVPAPQPKREKPLPLPQSKLFPVQQRPQQVFTPPSIPKPIGKSRELIQFPTSIPTQIPEFIPSTQSIPPATQSPESTEEQSIPPVIQSPENITQPTPQTTQFPESNTQPIPQTTQFPESSTQPTPQ